MHAKITKAIADLVGPKHYFALLISLLSLTVIAPLVDHDAWTHIIVSIFLILSLLTASMALNKSRFLTFVSILLVALSGIMWILSSMYNCPPFGTIYFQLATFAVTLLFFLATGRVMWQDIFSGAATGNRICGAVCLYLLIGFCFAMLHLMVALCNPNEYKDTQLGDKSPICNNTYSTRGHYPIFVYFSFCTLTTVGYGDIIPAKRLSRSLCWVEAVTGQLYLAILVARLVGLHIVTRQTYIKEKSSTKSLLN